MSFDVFFQGFLSGDAVPGGGDRMREVLRRYVEREEPEHHFLEVHYGDGTADVYLDDDDMMANHISGEAPWGLLVEGARAAGWVILPTGCPPCITDESQRAHLPEGLAEEAVLVTTTADLLRAIRTS